MSRCGTNRLWRRSTLWIVLCLIPATSRAQDKIPEYVTATLKNWKVEPTAKGINEYLQKLRPDSAEQKRAAQLVENLGNADFETRQRATRELLLTPVLPIELLLKAKKNGDAEVRRRARHVLEHRGTETSSLLYAVFLAVETGRLAGTTDDLLKTIPLCDQHYLRHAVRKSVAASAGPEDVPRLKTALINKNSHVQAAAVFALERVLKKNAAGELLPLLENAGTPDVTALAVAQVFANWGDRRCLSVLLRLMSSEEIRVRTDAVATLRVLTGQHFGFAAYDSDKKRTTKTDLWKNWLAANRATAKLKSPLPSLAWGNSSLGGNLLLAFGYQNKVVEYDPSGKEVWNFACKGAWSAEKLPNGHVLIAGYYEKKVLEVDHKKNVVWSYDVDRCLNARKLQNGNYLIAVASGRKVLEVTRDKKIVWQYATKGNCRDVHRLQNGNTLIGSGNIIEEISPDNKQVWAFHASQPYGIQPLRNGNLLVADWNGRVIEVTRDKKIIWEHKISRPGDAYRLPNGNTLVTTDKAFFEITPDKNVVWEKKGCRYGHRQAVKKKRIVDNV